MPVGRSFIRQQAGNALVVGSLAASSQPAGGAQNLDKAEQEIAQSRYDVSANGGRISSGPQQKSTGSFVEHLATASSNIKTAYMPPLRMSIQSIDRPLDRVEAQFNPERLKETITANWNRFEIPGLSHEPMQYGFTANGRYEFELLFDAGKGAHPIKPEAVQRNLQARNLLASWKYLRKQDVLGNIGDTQRLLFIWPNFISLTCVMSDDTVFEYEMFNSIGQPTSFRVQMKLEEIRDVILYAEDILSLGNQRSSSGKPLVDPGSTAGGVSNGTGTA